MDPPIDGLTMQGRSKEVTVEETELHGYQALKSLDTPCSQCSWMLVH